MKHIISLQLLLVALVFTSANAADLATVQTTLNIISDFTDKLCKTPPLQGGTEEVELSGSAKAELNQLLKKVANLGVEGAVKYQSEQYSGLLQKDLANVLRDSNNCRLEVWGDLKDKLFPQEPKVISPASEKHSQINDSIGQQDLIEKLNKAEEDKRHLEEAVRMAKAEKEAQAAIVEFNKNVYPMYLDLNPEQEHALALLFRDNARAEEIDVHLELYLENVGMTVADTPGAFRRMRSILDAAAQVAAGTNVSSKINGKTRKERLHSFAEVLLSQKKPLKDPEVSNVRRLTLKYPTLYLR